MNALTEKNLSEIVKSLDRLIIALNDFNIEFEYQSNRLFELLKKDNEEDANEQLV